jgi:hypothetical protein
MPEPVVAVAESTTAETPLTSVAPQDPAAYAAWRFKGRAPEPKTADPASAKPSASGDEPGDNTAPAPEAGTHKQEPKRSTAETRLQEVLADLKRAGLSPSELKTYKREAQATLAAPAGDKDVKPAPSAAPAPTQPSDLLKPPVKPNFAQWTGTWEAREAAIEKYHEENSAYQARKAVSDFQTQQAQQAQERELTAKVADANKRYGETAGDTIVATAKGIFSADSGVPGVVSALIDQSPVIVDLLYSLGSKADVKEFVALAKSNPGADVRKIVLMEQLVQDELAKGAGKPDTATETETAARDTSGRFRPAKTASKAPAPPREVSGHASAPLDAVESASTGGDFKAYSRAANARDLARRRG